MDNRPATPVVFLVLATLAASAALSHAQRPGAPDTLTSAEKSAGWVLLFDGTATDAWRGYKKADMSGLRWKVEEGCLALPAGEGADTRGQRDIITKQQFDDFELSWDWRIAKGGNSGVKYFVTEKYDAAIGHEYQVIDGAHADAALRQGRRQTAAFYDVLAAPAASPRPAPSFNTGRVLVKGNHVEHWLNGTKLLEFEIGSPDWTARVAASKFKPYAEFGKTTKGKISLQDHGNVVSFRDIRIRPITS
jgi:3-keto-disaccharide hydrolase